MIRGILVALDGSLSSNTASAVAIRLAARHKTTIEALGIIDADFIQRPQAVPAGAMSYKHALDLKLVEDAGQRVEAVLNEFAGKARQANVNFTTRQVEGEPRSAIEGAAIGNDLIVLGRASLSAADGELSSLPMCVEQILRRGIRPTLVIPEIQIVDDAGRERSPIVIAFDGSIVSSRALHLFALLGLGRGRPVHVLAQNDGSTKNAEATAERACVLLRAHGLRRVHAIGLGDMQAGKPAESILGTAKSVDAGMIVMGAYGHHGIQEVFGSCTRSVLAGLETPVLMYH